MTDPARAACRWLAIAVAMRWVVRVGGHAAGRGSAAMLDDLPPSAPLPQRTTPGALLSSGDPRDPPHLDSRQGVAERSVDP